MSMVAQGTEIDHRKLPSFRMAMYNLVTRNIDQVIKLSKTMSMVAQGTESDHRKLIFFMLMYT